MKDLVRCTCEDGRDFIRTVISSAIDNPLPPYSGPKLSQRQLRQESRVHGQSAGNPPPPESQHTLPPRRAVTQFVMNLPDSALDFLDAFRGILTPLIDRGLSNIYTKMPLIHCYCFTRELELDKATEDIRQVRGWQLRGPI